MRTIYICWLDKIEVKGPLGRPRRRGEDDIRINLREIRLKVVDWIHVAENADQWRVVS
jgi:hypothetical protein